MSNTVYPRTTDSTSPWAPPEAADSLSLPEEPLGAGLSPEEGSFLGRLILYGFLIRAAVAILLHFTGYSTRLAPDEPTYDEWSWELMLYWSGDLLVKPRRFFTEQPMGYFYLNAAYFYVFGQTVLPLKLTNALVGALTCRYVYLLGRGIFGPPVGRRTALLYQYFPSLILWSAVNIRDVWVVFLILYASWKSLQILRGYSHLALASFIASVYFLSLFRDYLFYVVALPPVVALLIGKRGHLVRNFVIASIAAVGLVMLLQQGVVGQRTRSRMSLEAISEARRDMATGSSAFMQEVDISTPGKALAFLPIGVAYFLFSPFPWEITSVLKLFSLPEMLLLYWLTPSIVRGIRYALRERFRESLQVLLLTGLLTVSYALGEGNVGTLYRHRAQAITFYLMFASAGLEIARAREAAPGEEAA